jgi:Uncharacterised nucleotidyltransferase
VERRALDEFVERSRGLRHRAELDAAAIAVLDAFDALDVQSLLLKGPALARLLYTPNEHRGYSDVDLLIGPGDLPSARGALTELGFSDVRTSIFGIDDVSGILHAETWTRRGAWAPVMIDLHWRLPGCDAAPDSAWPALLARRTWIEVDNRRVPVLDRTGLAVHLATHAAQHGPADVKALGDLARGLERWSLEVWQSAARLAEELQGIDAFAAGLRLLPEGAAMASELELPSTDELSWQILHRDTRPRGTFHVQALAEARGLRERADLLRRSLVPTRAWIEHQYEWAAGSRGRMLAAHAIHLLRAPVWAVRAWRFRHAARRIGAGRT